MNISPQVNAIAELLATYSQGALDDVRMIERFLQHAHDSSRHAELGDLAFHAKFLTRVQSTIRRQAPGTDLYDKLEKEFSTAVHEFHGRVGEFVENAEPDFRTMVDQHYLAVNEQSLRNLMRLANDFTWLKNWELEMTQENNRSSGDTPGEN